MVTRLFWMLAIALYAGAAVVASIGEAAVDYRVWLLIGLGTVLAVLGNVTNRPDLWTDDSHEPKAH
jgi:1,4-dihydroxy-2-naphthoate octaprenyltransferase